MVYDSQGLSKAGIFVPATAAQEHKAREAVRKYQEAAEKVQNLEAKEALLRQRDQDLTKRDQDLTKRDQELGLEISEINQRMHTRDQVIQQRDKEMQHREKAMQKRDLEIKAMEAQLAALQLQEQKGTNSAATRTVGTPSSTQSTPAALASATEPMPTKGPKFVALNAVARIALFNKDIPKDRICESDRQQARDQVWRFMVQNDPKSGPIPLNREKLCAKLTPEGISAVVIRCIRELTLKKCDFGAFKNEIALPNLLTAIKEQKQVEHLHFGGHMNDAEVNGQNTCFTDGDLAVLANEIQQIIQRGRKLTITFDDELQTKRFGELMIRQTPAKPLPVIPPKPDRRTAPIDVALSSNTPPQLVPNRGSPPKGQA